MPTTWVEVDAKAINYNLKQFRKLLGKKAVLMAVVKANAYGHGLLPVAELCDKNREVDKICVVNSDEARALIAHGVKKSLMILSFFDLDVARLVPLVKKNVIFPLYSLKQARALNAAGERAGKKVKIHLKIDTGAGRVGVLPEEIPNFVNKIKKFNDLTIDGVFSHYASSEDDEKFTRAQYRKFQAAIELLAKRGIKPKLKHISCSAASALYSFEGQNAARIGIGIYGLYSSPKMRKKIKLKPALSWFTRVIHVKTVPAGAKIGYGGTYAVKKIARIITLPVGYWDGYDRRFSNKAQVIINGKKYPVRGRICMNLTMAEAGFDDKIKPGDIAILAGESGNKKITIDDLANWADTINYEVVDRINPLLPRIIR